jgi:DNA primase
MYRKIGDSWGSKYMFPDGVKKSDNIFFEHLVDFSQPVILTEGVFDAINIGYNAIPLMGSFVTRKIIQRLLDSHTPEVILFLDDDAVRQSIEAFDHLTRKGINLKLVLLEKHKDAGSMNKNQIRGMLANLEHLSLQRLLELKSSLPTPMPSMPPQPTMQIITQLSKK